MSRTSLRIIVSLLVAIALAQAGQDLLRPVNSGFVHIEQTMGRRLNGIKIDGAVKCAVIDNGGGLRLGLERGWAEWSVTGIPDTVVIDSAFCISFCSSISAEIEAVNLSDMTNRPTQTQDPYVLYDDAGEGDRYGSYPDPGIGWRSVRLTEAGCQALQQSLAVDWFAIGYAGTSYMKSWSINYDGFSNDSAPKLVVYYSDPVPGHDVGCTRLLAPSGQLDSGSTVTPACSVYNYGLFSESYTVRMAIGANYEEVMQIMAHEPGTAQYVTFPDWTADGRNRFNVTCSTELDGDNNTRNDFVRAFVNVLVHDVSARQIVVPGDSVSAGSVTPIAVFRTTGNVREPARAFFSINDSIGALVYSESLDLLSGVPMVDSSIRFPNWLATLGSYTARCSIDMAGDMQPANNALGRAFVVIPMVPFHDAGCAMITAPSGMIDSGASVTPACSVYNYGNQVEDYGVRMIIGGLYEQTAPVAGHEPGTMVYVTFPDWQAQFPGSYAVTCSTELVGDTAYYNNTALASAEVVVRDVAVSSIEAPTGTVLIGPVTPKVKVRNVGSSSLRDQCRVFFFIGDSVAFYSDSVDLPAGLPPADTTVSFASWTAVEGDSFFSRCSIYMVGDMQAANDVKSGTFNVSGQLPGWERKRDLPVLPSSKGPKDGAWLAHDRGTEFIYAAKGNKQADFYRYDPVGDTWQARANWPLGIEAKPPSKGANGTSDGNGLLYATKGNNTQGFWRYDAVGDSWSQKSDVPLGFTNKKVKGGTDIAFASNGLGYLLKGYKNEFWRYHPDGDSWSGLTNAPVGVNLKWDKGSWLVYDGDANRVYAHKAKYHEFYYYDVAADTWSALLPAMPIPGSAGNKKSKDGGCGAIFKGTVYALKGGNTLEYWRFDPAGAIWTELEQVPLGVAKKKAKAGADVAATDKAVYMMKGNKTFEFYKYVPGGYLESGSTGRDGVAAERLASCDLQLAISPNPLAGGFATVSYSLPRQGGATVTVSDVAGRVVHSSFGIRTSSFRLDLRSMPAGVYLVKLTSGGFSATQKLVVQH